VARQEKALARGIGQAVPIIASALATSISILRLHLSNQAVWTDVLWAEDGLFTLCAARDGVHQCLLEPYAGYLHLWPKLVAGIPAQFPIEAWPAITLLVSALTAGVVSAYVAWILIRQQIPPLTALLAAVIPVLLPAVGEEAVGSIANSTYLITIAGAIGVAFPLTTRTFTLVTAMLLLLVTMSTPIGFVLLALLLWQMWQGRFSSHRQSTVLFASAATGSAIQLAVIVVARAERPFIPVISATESWASGVGLQTLKLVPPIADQVVGRSPMDGFLPTLGLLIAICLMVAGIYLVRQASNVQVSGAGWLILIGLVASIIPHIANPSLARYFVAPLALWITAGLVLLAVSRPNIAIRTAVIVLAASVGVTWSFDFRSPESRSGGNPAWSEVVGLARTACEERPDERVGFVFSPWWPNSPDGSDESLARSAPCSILD